MVVDGRHFKNTLAAGALKIGHLDDDGQHLNQIDESYDGNKQRHAHHVAGSSHKAAQGQGTGIAHEHLGRIYIEQQKSQQASHHCSRYGADAHVLTDGHNGKKGGNQYGNACTETVQTIGKIHPVIRSQHNEEQRGYKEDSQGQETASVKTSRKRNQHIRSHLPAVKQVPGEDACDDELAH